MSKIEQRLNTLFQEHRIIIWYDEGGSLKDEFDSIELDIQKLELNNNEFGIKVKILYEDKNSKYLIYSNKQEPLMEDNWFLDIEYTFHIAIQRCLSSYNRLFPGKGLHHGKCQQLALEPFFARHEGT